MPGWPIGSFGSFVTSRLATGGAIAGRPGVAALRRAGITHVIDCRLRFNDGQQLAKSGLRYLWNPTADDGQTKPDWWFQGGLEFALSALSRPHQKVYVHCNRGVNRGPSMCYAIMRALGWAPADALRAIKRGCPQALVRYSSDADRAIRHLGYL